MKKTSVSEILKYMGKGIAIEVTILFNKTFQNKKNLKILTVETLYKRQNEEIMIQEYHYFLTKKFQRS